MNRAAQLDFDTALWQMLALAEAAVARETLSATDALDRVLAADQVSALDVPTMDTAQMDGWAVRVADLAAGEALPVSQRIPAGAAARPLAPHSVARIFTGATVPEGADAVVMQEQASADGDRVRFAKVPPPGEWIRRTGEDIRRGATLLATGTRLTPQALGLAASVGLAMLPVRPRLRVACFFTGVELAMPGEPLPPGAIYNSNRFVLGALLRRLGCEVVDLGIVPDTLEATRAALREAACGTDLIVTSGGMSVGEEDHVRPALQAEGELRTWQIAIKPGKPLAWGRVWRDGGYAHFIGLPGNPVSSLVTFMLLVRPFVSALQGVSSTKLQPFAMRADFVWPRADKRREFLRVRRNAQGGLDLFENQSSGVLTSAVWGDGLIDNPPGRTIAVGDMVDFIPFSHWMS
jgi:molybdopterin molybdotransferase